MSGFFGTSVSSSDFAAETNEVGVLVHFNRIAMRQQVAPSVVAYLARNSSMMSNRAVASESMSQNWRQGGGLAILLAAVASAGAASPAWACSDLPNICAQNQAVFDQNVDMARDAAANYAEGRDAERNGGRPAGPPPRDPMDIRMDLAAGNIFALHAMATDEIEKMKRDPEMGPIIRGKWDFFQDTNDAAPGEYCAALYMNMAGLVRLSGPGGNYRGALLTFWGPNIPQPEKVRWVSVTLKQVVNNDPNNSSTQTVRAYNYTETRVKGVGAIALAVRSADVLLDNMSDLLDFKLEIDGKEVQAIGVHGGLSARDSLRQCIARRKS